MTGDATAKVEWLCWLGCARCWHTGGVAASRPKSQPRPVADPLKALLRRQGWLQALNYVEILRCWPKVVGEVMAQQTWPESLKESTLVVAATHPAWKHELHYRQEEILRRLAQMLGPGVVRTISTLLRPRRTPPPVDVVPGAEATQLGMEVARVVGGEDDLLKEAIQRAAAANAEARFRGLLR